MKTRPSPGADPAFSTDSLWPDATLDDLLALAGKKYELCFEPVSAGGVSLQMLQIANMREILDKAISEGALKNALDTLPLWAKIWPASLILGHCLARLPREHTVLEIGAGCGVTGLVAAALGFSKVYISDINEDALLFARINVLKNQLPNVRVCRVDIASTHLQERFSLILGAEILYLEPLYRPLAAFLVRHLAHAAPDAPEPAALLASDHRRNPRHFFKMAERSFRVAHQQIGVRAADDGDNERHLLSLHKLVRDSAQL